MSNFEKVKSASYIYLVFDKHESYFLKYEKKNNIIIRESLGGNS